MTGYKETDVYFLVEKQITYSTYTMSEGDKCAIEYINKSLENQCITDEILDSLDEWIIPDNPRRKKHIELVTEPDDDSYEEHVSLFDILVAAAQVAMVILAYKWWW